MGTKVRTLAWMAGVECPKIIGEMGKDKSCLECEYYDKCLQSLNRFFEEMSDSEGRILKANLKATERYLHELGQGSFAYYVRQALDKLYPNWRLEK